MFLNKYFFLTNRENNITYFYIPSTEISNKNFDRYVYYPEIFETMTQKEIQSYKRKSNLKFLVWAFRNQKKIEDQTDLRIALSRFFDLNTYFTLSLIGSFTLNKFIKRIDIPFVQMLIEERFSYSRLVNILTLGLTALGFYQSYVHITGQHYLFDLALKYKEKFIPGELYSDNCENIVKFIQEKSLT